ncbi:MAG TPA: PP2C family serine/threonine-protein phosphatase [Blastocatellia bacterium]|nr:PP2C family serine/threonine-protein phosphatase [Blastocatellia bacterium]
MSEHTARSRWWVIGRSVRGASHERTGLANQDAIGWMQVQGEGQRLIVAVSDGHGSAKYFRSHIGSRLAIKTALALGQEFLDGQPDLKNLTTVKRTAEERLPQEMARQWTEAVKLHIESDPLSDDELGELEKTDGPAARESIATNPIRAYGATIVMAIVEGSFILYLQLGDGDILLVSDSGEVTRALPNDERLFANETTSLGSQNSWPDFRFAFQTLVGDPPALILLSTDGYANSFVNEDAFLKVGKDMLEILRAESIVAVDQSLEGWLTEASTAGSGDDTTLAIVCRADALSNTPGASTDKGVAEAAGESASSEHGAIETQAVAAEGEKP